MKILSLHYSEKFSHWTWFFPTTGFPGRVSRNRTVFSLCYIHWPARFRSLQVLSSPCLSFLHQSTGPSRKRHL